MPEKITFTRPGHLGVDEEIKTIVATEQELLDFANEIRKHGGANVLEALLPSHPSEANRCLIARALNFSCEVDCTEYRTRCQWADGSSIWGMFFPENMEPSEAKRICKAMKRPYDSKYHIMVLPKHIGNAAQAFDDGLKFQKYNADEGDEE